MIKVNIFNKRILMTIDNAQSFYIDCVYKLHFLRQYFLLFFAMS